MRRMQRISAVLVCALLVLTVMLSSVYIVRAANHDCTGECCLVCVTLARVERLLSGLVVLLPGLLALALAGAFKALWSVWEACPHLVRRTLVSWKIRLND